MFGGGGDMKKSPSELALEALLWSHEMPEEMKDQNIADSPTQSLDILSGISSVDGLAEAFLWSPSLTNKQSGISLTIDSQSSLCDDDAGIEAGPCEQSTDPSDIKRLRRKISNRLSAMRSRRRKQAELQELESQVKQLMEAKASLLKQLADANHHFRDSVTSYRVLKSDVDALRAKVKLAEELVAQGSLTSSFNQLLRNHLNSPQLFNPLNSCRLPNLSPTVTVHGDSASYVGTAVSGQNLDLGLENADVHNVGHNNGIMSDVVSCVSGMWPDEFVSTLSK